MQWNLSCTMNEAFHISIVVQRILKRIAGDIASRLHRFRFTDEERLFEPPAEMGYHVTDEWLFFPRRDSVMNSKEVPLFF